MKCPHLAEVWSLMKVKIFNFNVKAVLLYPSESWEKDSEYALPERITNKELWKNVSEQL